jgi:hypothetical protein
LDCFNIFCGNAFLPRAQRKDEEKRRWAGTINYEDKQNAIRMIA